MPKFSPSDARLAVLRRVSGVFLNLLLEFRGATPDEEEVLQDEQFANELGIELLDSLGIEVLGVEDDGSMTLRVAPDHG